MPAAGILGPPQRARAPPPARAMIDTGNLPPLAELLAMDDRGELP